MTTTLNLNLHQAPAGVRGTSGASAGEILVPIDFSKSSVRALHHASAVAASRQAPLTLLNVLEEPASFRALDLAAQQRQSHHSHIRRLEELARHELDPELPVRLLVCDGEPSEQIRRVAAEERASLIVLGRHEHHRLRHWLGGNTVARVADQAPCPVLVLGDEPGGNTAAA